MTANVSSPPLVNAPAPLPALPRIDVRWFRGIRRLTIPRLEWVNLFVGMNNAGKTSLLDAIRLYTSMAAPRSLLQTLMERDGLSNDSVRENNLDAISEALSHLFLEIGSEWTNKIEFDAGPGEYPHLRLTRTELSTDEHGEVVFGYGLGGRPALNFYIGGAATTVLLEGLKGITTWKAPRRKSIYVGPHGVQLHAMAQLWDGLALTEGEDRVMDGLRILLPAAERVSFLDDPERPGRRFPVVKLQGQPEPVRVSVFGDGTVRLFGLMLALVSASGGTLLLDEIENGLHHSVQDQVWSLIFDLAGDLDVQVMATTHSWDAVVGFQNAAVRSPVVGMLYRLEREEDGNIYVETYTEEDVAVAAEHQVEVR